tara:strand:+ start:150 stop:377 length:228 start_codon:yes stop_codon:yes gene_type:complete
MTTAPPKDFLNNPKYLFTLLTAIVKKNGGEIDLTVEDFTCVTRHDLVSMYYDKKTRTVTLKAVDLPPPELGDDEN